MSETGDTGSRKGKGDGRHLAFSVIDRRPLFGDDAPPSTQPRFPTYVEELKARTEEAERRAREISAAYRRIEEEREAFRDRLWRDLEGRVDSARVSLMRRMLEVLDDLDRAIAAAGTATDTSSLLAGVALIRDRLLQVLASEGVQALETLGRRFDPAVAEAVAAVETPDPGRDNLVLDESARGYMLGAKLLRPARVTVARYRAPSTEHQPEAPAPARETGRGAVAPESADEVS